MLARLNKLICQSRRKYSAKQLRSSAIKKYADGPSEVNYCGERMNTIDVFTRDYYTSRTCIFCEGIISFAGQRGDRHVADNKFLFHMVKHIEDEEYGDREEDAIYSRSSRIRGGTDIYDKNTFYTIHPYGLMLLVREDDVIHRLNMNVIFEYIVPQLVFLLPADIDNFNSNIVDLIHHEPRTDILTIMFKEYYTPENGTKRKEKWMQYGEDISSAVTNIFMNHHYICCVCKKAYDCEMPSMETVSKHMMKCFSVINGGRPELNN